MRSRTLQASFTSTGGTVVVDSGVHGTFTATIVAGTVFATIDDLCDDLTTQLSGVLSGVRLGTTGKVAWQLTNSWLSTLTISEAAMATYLATADAELVDGWVDEWEGSVCPGWWSGYVRRDWQYEYGSEYSAVNTHQGGQRTPGRVRSGDIVLWSSVAALTEIEQLYRCLYYALDRHTLTDDLSRTFVIGDAGRIEAVPQSHPMTYLRLPLIRVEP